MPHEVPVASSFPNRVDLPGRADCFLRLAQFEDAADIYQLISDNPYISHYQYWARHVSLEDVESGMRERLKAIEAGTSVQYRIMAHDSNAYGGIVGTVTAFDYNDKNQAVSLGYYQAEASQGKGRMIEAVRHFITLLRSAWGVQIVELGIEDGNERSINLAQKLGAVQTDEFRENECDEQLDPTRVWRLTL